MRHYSLRPRLEVLLILLLILGACAAPPPPSPPPPTATAAPTALPATPLPTPVALEMDVRSEQGGFSLEIPRGWQTREISSTLAMAPTSDALEMATPGENLVIIVESLPAESEPAANLEEAFARSGERPRQAGYSLGEPTPVTVGGIAGLGAELNAAGGAGQLIVLLTPTGTIRVLGNAAPAAWERQRPLFEAIVASLQFFEPVPLPTPIPPDAALQPALTTEGSPELVLRLGGNSGATNSRFASARGLAVAADGTIYLAERSQGVWVFQPDGTLLKTFGKEDLVEAYDVAIGADGTIFVADYASNAIARFSAEGRLLGSWGSAGDAPDQFGFLSPQRIAVASDGSLYALDDRSSPDGSVTVVNVVQFASEDGRLLNRIELPPGTAPNDIAVDRRGTIYLADSLGGAILRINERGEVLARLGADVEGGIAAGAIDLDAAGNIYAATWNSGIIKLAPGGTVIARGGEGVAQGITPQPGQFVLPNGIAVGRGGIVWVSDNSGEYSALTALRLTTDTDAVATARAMPAMEATVAVSATIEAMTTTPREELRQWARSATASSFYEGYPPEQALGPPDAQGCQDSQNAWASADPNGLETLELRYETPVFAIGVNVHQNLNPGYITKIELIDAQGNASTVYTADPVPAGQCPAVLEARFPQSVAPIVAVRLTIDQRSGANWNEIDAVELIGGR